MDIDLDRDRTSLIAGHSCPRIGIPGEAAFPKSRREASQRATSSALHWTAEGVLMLGIILRTAKVVHSSSNVLLNCFLLHLEHGFLL